MTYDPFSYGQVKLGDGKSPGAASGSPEDILFAEPKAAAKKPAAPVDSSWELLDADVSTLLPNAAAPLDPSLEFGAEILGESAPEPVPTESRPRAASAPRPESGSRPTGKSGAPVRRTVGVRPTGAEPAPAAAAGKAAPVAAAETQKKATVRPAARPIAGPPARVASALVPAAVFAVGGTGAAWLYAMEQNVVMASIVGALAVVGALFARIWLRG